MRKNNNKNNMLASGRYPVRIENKKEQKKKSVLEYKLNYLDLDPLGGLARHILPPLSPSQPVTAEKKISCWGKEPSRSSLRKLVAEEITNIFVQKALSWCFPGISEFRQLRSGLASSASHRPAPHRSAIARSNAAPCSALRCPAALA